MTQRDIFLIDLLEIAKQDENVILISPDMGAPSIDLWKEQLPKQFFAVGIAEQNAINFAAGLSSQGKKVYVYFMACWSCRCLEQIRYSCAIGNNPITILGCGVGLGYSPAGPAHNPTDDIGYMRSICNIEIFSPATVSAAKALVKYSYDTKKLLYIRLERSYNTNIDVLYNNFIIDSGMFTLKNIPTNSTCILSNGYMLSRGLELANKFNFDLIDVYKLKPISQLLINALYKYDTIITIEEQSINCGGFGSIISDIITDNQLKCQLIKFGLPEQYILTNGTREELLNDNNLSIEYLSSKINDMINKIY